MTPFKIRSASQMGDFKEPCEKKPSFWKRHRPGSSQSWDLPNVVVCEEEKNGHLPSSP